MAVISHQIRDHVPMVLAMYNVIVGKYNESNDSIIVGSMK